MRRYKPTPKPTLRELELGKPAMSKRERKARRTLEVKIVFEPSRLAAEYLADAYAQIVPLRIRSKQIDQNEQEPFTLTLAESEWREQA